MINTTSQAAQDLASRGRYGDSMLVHMNPEEVAGIASLAPGQMTINPETGLPEAFKFRDFLQFALPIAGSIALPAMAPTLAGSSVFAKAALSGVGSGLGSLLAGSNSKEALASGLTAGLTYGLGSKFLPEGTGDTVNKAFDPKASVAKIDPIRTKIASTAPINYKDPSAVTINRLFSPPSAAKSVSNLDKVVAKTFTPAEGGRHTVAYNYPSTSSSPTNFLGKVTENPAGTIGLGLSGAAGALAATPVEAEDNMVAEVDMADPWRRKIKYPGSGQGSREFDYFAPSGIYGASGGYVKNMQEGGEVMGDEPSGIMAYAPLIANYPSYDAGIGAMPTTPPAGITGVPMRAPTPVSTVERDYGVGLPNTGRTKADADRWSQEVLGTFVPELEYSPSYDDEGIMQVTPEEARSYKYGSLNRGDMFDARKAPAGYMWSARNPHTGHGSMGGTEYVLNPIKNLSPDEVRDLVRSGNLTQYRPEGAKYIDYRPQVGKTEGSGDGMFGDPLHTYMQEGGLATISEGMVSGNGDGMSDNVYGDIGGVQKVALSEGEFIVPADVVSGIGNGSSESGAERLYGMMDRIRKARTGTMQQAPAIDVSAMMPA